MMEKESIAEIRKRQETFFSDFSLLLKKPIKPESEETKMARDFADSLKWTLRNLVHQVAKLDLGLDVKTAESLLDGYVEKPLIRFVEQQSKPWMRDKLTIAIMGHYSHGKTSVLNCLFDQHFPVQGSESTALATYLSYGENTNIINLVDKGGSIQEILDEKKEVGLLDYKISNNFPFARFFDYIEKECNVSLLENLTFIDTPGLFSEKTGHSDPTTNVLVQTDVILWCERLDRGFEDTSIEFLQKSVSPTEKPIFLLGTFADNVRNTEDVLSHFVSKAEDNGIKLSGCFIFGKDQTLQKEFKNDFYSHASNWAEEYETVDPITQILYLVHSMIDFLKDRQKQIKEALTQLNSKSDELENNLVKAFKRFNSSTNSFQNSYSNLIDTFNSRCVGAWGCGGAEGAMRSRIDSTRSSWNSVIDAYNNIEINDALAIGNIANKLADVENDGKAVDDLIQEFENIYKQFVN